MRVLDADALFNDLLNSTPIDYRNYLIETKPIQHGRWLQAEVIHDRKDAKIPDWQQAKCSVCRRWHTIPFMYYLKLDKYCPNCGAKMDEVENG